MSEDKLGLLLEHLLDLSVENAYIENDAFVLEFSDGTFLELYSENGDLDLYYQMPSEEPKLH